MIYLRAILSISVLVFLAWLISENRRRLNFKFIISGLLLQFLIAAAALKLPFVLRSLEPINSLVSLVQNASLHGAQFMFGYLSGGPTPFDITKPQKNFIIAFQVLPMIIVVSALSSLLFHLKILPLIIKGFSFVLDRTFKLSGPLGFGSASTVFLGTIEAPLLIKPYLHKLSRSDLFALITCTMSTISGTVMVLYASVLNPIMPNAVVHLLVASLISVPAALILARVMIPSDIQVTGKESILIQPDAFGPIDAILKGTLEGIQMVINIAGVIICFFAVIFIVNQILVVLGINMSLQALIGAPFKPLLFLSGIPWSETGVAGDLMGTKIVLNEFVAYMDLQKLASQLSPTSQIIMTYNLCGFANFASVGIVVGGLSTIIPERRREIANLSLKSLISGNLAVMMTGTMVSVFIS